MAKKFVDGVMFGAGFAISFILIWSVAAYWITPHLIASHIKDVNRGFYTEATGPRFEGSSASGVSPPGKQFYELGIDDQIKQSTAIALARYERAPDGKMRAVIKEFLKKDPKAEIYYNIGDEFVESSYYPKVSESHGDGVIAFFTGSPATMAMSTTFTGDRIAGLGDLPIELLKTKCKKPSA